MTVQEFTASLRELADFYDSHPDVPVPWLEPINVFPTKEQLPTIIRALGSCKKTFNDTFFQLEKRIGQFEVHFSVYRDQVCRKVVVGKKLIPATPAQMVDEVEWVCEDPAILS